MVSLPSIIVCDDLCEPLSSPKNIDASATAFSGDATLFEFKGDDSVTESEVFIAPLLTLSALSRLFLTLYDRFLVSYGKCNMPYNFHVMLYCQHDCFDWSSLRSHSTFKFDRLYHELIMAPRSSGSNKITQSIVRVVCELPSRHSKTNHSVISSQMGWPLSCQMRHHFLA